MQFETVLQGADLPYLRDHFDVAVLAALAANLHKADDLGGNSELDDLAPAPA